VPTSKVAALARRGTGGVELPLTRTAHAAAGELPWETTPCLRACSARGRAPPVAALADMDYYALWVWSPATLMATLSTDHDVRTSDENGRKQMEKPYFYFRFYIFWRKRDRVRNENV
jgi:hypothetical protein